MVPMQMDGLQVYGIPSTVTEIWRQAVGEHLLPIQEEAVTTYGLFGGGNLLVSAPTSSGKTFVGELAAFHEAYKGGRVVYLVPLRAVAEEKYDEFRDRYKEYGVSVIISTGDHREYDEDLLSGNFHLAVVVFEKLLNLSVAKPAVLDYPTLVVVDECQMISDESRGARLETLLTKIRKLAAPPRFIGLSAVAENTGGFDSWLNCELLAHKERPVELREGVVTNDFMFTYREWNTGAKGSEQLGVQMSS
jgi:helicase